jgi:outer membrane protein assembly factor BamD (BamD/ComL family)
MVDAYRALNMNDLAADAARVYDANYPTNARDVEARKSWWRRIL